MKNEQARQGRPFECADDPPRDNCPIESGESLHENADGTWMCPFCLADLGHTGSGA